MPFSVKANKPLIIALAIILSSYAFAAGCKALTNSSTHSNGCSNDICIMTQAGTNSAEFMIGVTSNSSTLEFCKTTEQESSLSVCSTDSNQVINTSLVQGTNQNRKIYKTSSSVALSDNLMLKILVKDANGGVIARRLLKVTKEIINLTFKIITHNITKPSKTNANWSPILTDIMQHEGPDDTNNYNDLVTLGHETLHGINSYLRNKINPPSKPGEKSRISAFYLLDNKAAEIHEPSFTMKDLDRFIPQSLKKSRYQTYVGQHLTPKYQTYYGVQEIVNHYNNAMGHIFEEWNTYTTGGQVGIDLVKNNKWKYGSRDAVAGVIEMTAFASSVLLAAKELEPNYFSSNSDLKSFYKFMAERSMSVFLEGKDISYFKGYNQDEYLNAFRTSSDAETLRQFLRDTFGSEWTKSTFGF